MFDMYSGMLDNAARAAREEWGAAGVWIPETTFFNGPGTLPEDVARELQDMVLARTPFDQRSAHFDWFAENKNRHNSRWNYRADGGWEEGHYVFKPKGTGIFGHTTHILGVAARIGNLGVAALSVHRRPGVAARPRVSLHQGGRRVLSHTSPTCSRTHRASTTSTTRTAASRRGTRVTRRTKWRACA